MDHWPNRLELIDPGVDTKHITSHDIHPPLDEAPPPWPSGPWARSGTQQASPKAPSSYGHWPWDLTDSNHSNYSI